MPDYGYSKDALRAIVGLTGEFVGTTDTATVTNKTINTSDNTVTATSQAAGDILVNNATKFVRLPIGTAGQPLKVNAGATTVEYGTLPVAGGGTGAATHSAGIVKSPGGTGALTTVAAPTGAILGDSDVQNVTGGKTFFNQTLKLRNPANTFTTTVTNPAVTADTAAEILYSTGGVIEFDLNELNFRRVRMFERDPAIGEGGNIMHFTSSLAGGGPGGLAVYPKENYAGTGATTNQTISIMAIFATDYLTGGLNYDALDIQCIKLAGSGEGAAKYQIISILDGTGFKHPIEIGMYSGAKMEFKTDNSINFNAMLLSAMKLGSAIDFNSNSATSVNVISNSAAAVTLDLPNALFSGVAAFRGSVGAGLTFRANPNSTDATERTTSFQTLNASTDTYTTVLSIVPGGAAPSINIGTLATQKVGFFGTTPVVQQAANPDTSAASLAALETEVNELKAVLRAYGLIAP